MLSVDKWWATLFEECMSGCLARRGHHSSEARAKARGPPLGSPNNDEHRASQIAFGASFAACVAGWCVYSFVFV